MTDKLEPIQADRDAAADYLDATGVDWGACGDVRSGRTSHPAVDAFARHRVEHTTQPQGEGLAAEAIEWLESQSQEIDEDWAADLQEGGNSRRPRNFPDEILSALRSPNMSEIQHLGQKLANSLEALWRTAPSYGDLAGWVNENSHELITALRSQPDMAEVREALEAHEQYMKEGQSLVVKYLVPAIDLNSIEKDVFVSRVIKHFDGPRQRAVQAKARAALAKLEGKAK